MPATPSSALTSPSCIAPPPRERRVLLVQREHAAAQPLVLQRLAQHPGAGDRPAVVGEAQRARRRAARPSRSARSPSQPARDRGHEADGDARLARGGVAQRAQERRASRRPGRCSASPATAQKPPAAAARVPVSRSSLCSWPGRAQVHVRVDEGGQQVAARRRRRPRRRSGASSVPGAPSSAISPSRTRTSWRRVEAARAGRARARRGQQVGGRARAADERLGSCRLRLHRAAAGCGALAARAGEQLVEDGHADDDAGLDLGGDDRLRRVDDLAAELDAAVDRARGA